MHTIAYASVVSSGEPYLQQIQTSHQPLAAGSGESFHQLTADEPEDDGGKDAGPAPYQLYLAGLGACTSMTLQMYAERKGWQLGTVKIELELRKDSTGHTFIERKIHISEPLDEAQWARLLEIAGKTPVTRSVTQGATLRDNRG